MAHGAATHSAHAPLSGNPFEEPQREVGRIGAHDRIERRTRLSVLERDDGAPGDGVVLQVRGVGREGAVRRRACELREDRAVALFDEGRVRQGSLHEPTPEADVREGLKNYPGVRSVRVANDEAVVIFEQHWQTNKPIRMGVNVKGKVVLCLCVYD